MTGNHPHSNVRHDRLEVSVTSEDIARATRRDSRNCMIAEAIKATYPGALKILVDIQTIRWSDPKTGKRYAGLTPPKVAQALVDFDQGREVAPFQFTIRAVQTVKMRTGEEKNKKRAPAKMIARSHGEITIEGGVLPPTAALRSGAGLHPATSTLGQTRYRQYGRRLLQA